MSVRGTDWAELLAHATEKVQRSVSEIAAGRNRRLVVGTGAAGDKTLLADRKAEEELLSALFRVEGLRVLSEEAGNKGDAKADLVAVVDPLDGSSNFERGIPFYCTSVAIADGGSLTELSHALVRDLVTGDVYYAEKGKGARKNGRVIRTAKTADLSNAVLGIDISKANRETIAGLERVIGTGKQQVHYGANALELCYLADGRIDASIDIRGRMRVTDFAGGYLIAKEAGAVFSSDDEGELDIPLDLDARFGFVASANRTVHRQILERLSLTRGRNTARPALGKNSRAPTPS